MTLTIDPTTEEGKLKIETIKWAQDQMNEIAKQFFADKHRLIKGIRFEFVIKTDSAEQETIKVNVFELAPTSPEGFEQGIKEAKEVLGIKEQSAIIVPKGGIHVSKEK